MSFTLLTLALCNCLCLQMNTPAIQTETSAATTTAASRCGGAVTATTTAGTTRTSAAAVSDLHCRSLAPRRLVGNPGFDIKCLSSASTKHGFCELSECKAGADDED